MVGKLLLHYDRRGIVESTLYLSEAHSRNESRYASLLSTIGGLVMFILIPLILLSWPIRHVSLELKPVRL